MLLSPEKPLESLVLIFQRQNGIHLHQIKIETTPFWDCISPHVQPGVSDRGVIDRTIAEAKWASDYP